MPIYIGGLTVGPAAAIWSSTDSGATWTRETLPATTLPILGISGTADGSTVYAANEDDIFIRDALGNWTSDRTPFPGPILGESLWCSDDGNYVHCSQGYSYAAQKKVSGIWSDDTAIFNVAHKMYGFDVSANELWYGGQTISSAGYIQQYNSGWTGGASDNIGSQKTIYGMWGPDSSNLYVCTGRDKVFDTTGTVQKWTGSALSLVYTTSPAHALYGICGADDKLWTVGHAGFAYYYNGSTWANQSTGLSTSYKLYDCWATDATHCYAVGHYTAATPALLLHDGTGWSALSGGPSIALLYAVWGTAEAPPAVDTSGPTLTALSFEVGVERGPRRLGKKRRGA